MSKASTSSSREKISCSLRSPLAPSPAGPRIEHGGRQIALGDEILVRGIAVALGHLVVLVPHDGRAVDISGNLPAEGLVEEVILGGGGEVLAAADHVGDAHEVVIHHVGEV
jgi:hypothetical protein